jgi:hypothetical protein
MARSMGGRFWGVFSWSLSQVRVAAWWKLFASTRACIWAYSSLSWRMTSKARANWREFGSLPASVSTAMPFFGSCAKSSVGATRSNQWSVSSSLSTGLPSRGGGSPWQESQPSGT